MRGDEHDFYAEAMRANLADYHALPFRCTLHLDDGTGRTINGRTTGTLDKAGRMVVFITPDALPFDVLQSPAVSEGDYLLQIRCAPEGVDIHALESGDEGAGGWIVNGGYS